MTLAELQVIADGITSSVVNATTVEASAVTLLNQLGAFMAEHANDATAIETLGVGLTNAKGALDLSADALAAAVVANTPAA